MITFKKCGFKLAFNGINPICNSNLRILCQSNADPIWRSQLIVSNLELPFSHMYYDTMLEIKKYLEAKKKKKNLSRMKTMQRKQAKLKKNFKNKICMRFLNVEI